MMTATRGDETRPVYKLGDFFPERLWIEVNGEKHQGWVTTNRRYPRYMKAALDRARARYLKVVDILLEHPDGMLEGASAEAKAAYDQAMIDGPAAYDQLLTDVVMTLVPTLDEDTVTMIDQDACDKLLRELGYLPPENEEEPMAAAEEEDAQGVAEASAAPLTPDILPGGSRRNSRGTRTISS